MTHVRKEVVDMPIRFTSLPNYAGRWLVFLSVLYFSTLVLAGVSPPMTNKTWAAKPQSEFSKNSKIRTSVHGKTKLVSASVQVPETPLTEAELAIVPRIELGSVPCEFGAVVIVKADPQAPGYFDLQLKNLKFHMSPVETSTGAIRLEDRKAGAVWLQLSNKSMLMNQKLGQRLADACMSASQVAVAAALEKTPAQSLLDVLPAPVQTATTVVVQPLPVASVAGVVLVPLAPTDDEPPMLLNAPVSLPINPLTATK